jgi:hypothetical protein
MRRILSIHEVADDVLRAELVHLVQYLRELGHERCQLVFGWHWGMDYPPGAPWHPMDIALSELVTEIQKPEHAGLGEFGSDDVIISVSQHEWEFCHHHGIHLKFTPSSQVAQNFCARWAAAGLTVTESDCPPES